MDALRSPLTTTQWAVLVGWVGFSLYAEGYRAFQKRFSPRVVARAFHLGRHPRPLHVALAPFYCMSLLHASRRGLTVAWTMTLSIIGVIILVRSLSQPWRGIIDAGVVLALFWGVAAILWFFARGLTGRPPTVSPDLPTPAEPGMSAA